ncbi:P-loop NTPase fold protein [Hymenobacter arizonensis]|uniref:KAP family P-loop domain-containing protein n=1 Tax=Hymenobacter arizonensis TaxID=1227077 RepID=A0A1I5T916_HYMAR|nr:P-loop NTPase fold protein [Hymenobacter arizonensis]SFP79147.1 KAP family P-loop domain-containing protein [Hymenobacter arizonensis]
MSIQISIERQSQLFRQHFEEENNDRIIFSGAFGIGKTYFLDKFFASANRDYLAVKLAPVNYSVSANEDIFKLIKYDILFELLLHHGLKLDTDSVLIKWDVAYGLALPGKVQSIAEGLMKVLPLLNKSAEDIPAVVAALHAWFTAARAVETERTVPGADSDIEKFAESVGNIFSLEADHVTAFLEESLTRLAADKQAKAKVLIIDDLDRIDPEHIFRLFNIFSAHLDYHKTNRNKFGFDKVVFVCDIKNIKNIFLTRYGADTDFSGYIDKFYSKDVYFFTNTEEVRKAVVELVQAIQYKEESAWYYQQYILQGDRDNGRSFLEVVLTELVYAEALMVRRIVTSYKSPSQLDKELGFAGSVERQVMDYQLPAAIALRILFKILGGSEPMDKALRRLIKYERSPEYIRFARQHEDWLVGMVLPIVGWSQHRFGENPTSKHVYRNPDEREQSWSYNLIKVGHNNSMYYAMLQELHGTGFANVQSVNLHLNFFTLLHQAFLLLEKIGYLR